jgi:hypothetical protein
MTRYGTFFNAKCLQKLTTMGLFLTLLDRFQNHIFYERKRMKKLALFLTDVKFFFIATCLSFILDVIYKL